jgi:hypothetical protein
MINRFSIRFRDNNVSNLAIDSTKESVAVPAKLLILKTFPEQPLTFTVERTVQLKLVLIQENMLWLMLLVMISKCKLRRTICDLVPADVLSNSNKQNNFCCR